MNFQNDFAYTTSLNGWEAMSGSNPGAIVPITGVFEPADSHLRALTTAAFAIAPPVIDASPMDVWVDVLTETFTAPRTVGAIARLSTTECVMARVVRNGAGLTFGLFEYRAGAWTPKGSVNYPFPGGPTFRIGILVIGNVVHGIFNGEEVLQFLTLVTAPGRAAVRQEQYAAADVAEAVGGVVPGAGEEQLVYGRATIDCEYTVLGDLGFTGTRTDRELQWLQSHGATSKSLVMAWDEFLTLQGVPEGARPGRQYYWLLNILGGVPDKGGDTLIDLWHTFWCVHGGVVGNTQVPALSDPFFETELGVLWIDRDNVGGENFTYAPADFYVIAYAGLKQSAGWLKVGQNVTLNMRLKEAVAFDTAFHFRAQADSGSVFVSSTTIPAGSLLGTMRPTIATLPSGPGLSIAMMAEPAESGTLYLNDFSGEGGNDLSLWTYNGGNFPGGVQAGPPVPDTVAIVEGGVVKAVTANVNIQAPMADVADVEVEGVLPATLNGPGSNTRLVARVQTDGPTSIVACVNSSQLIVYDVIAGTANVAIPFINESVPGGATVKLRVVGDTVQIYLNGVLKGTGTVANLAPGKVGVGCYGWGGRALWERFRATSGGVHVESMSALLLEADGGPVQTLDPYFTGSANWQLTNGASVANNRLTLPNTGTARQGFLVAGQEVEVRLYIAQVAPGAQLYLQYPNRLISNTVGWHAFTWTPNGNEVRLYAQNVGATPYLVDFFFAAKTG